MRFFRQERILTQMCGNNFMILKTAPPLVANPAQIRRFADAAEQVVSDLHNSTAFWSDSMALLVARSTSDRTTAPDHGQ